jgi:hypothetical protein
MSWHLFITVGAVRNGYETYRQFAAGQIPTFSKQF